MNYLRKATNNSSTIVASLTATAAAIGIAGAATISINFQGNSAGTIAPTTVVGATGYAASNWVTTSALASGSQDNVGGTTADVTWSAGGTFFDSSATGSSGVENLLKGYLNNSGGPINITVSQIPYAQYTVVVYHSSNSGGGVWSPVSLTPLGESTQTLTLAGAKFNYGDNNSLDARNLVFENISQSEFSISIPTGTGAAGTGDRGGIAGIQIVQIPEPSAALLGALGFLVMLRRRR